MRLMLWILVHVVLMIVWGRTDRQGRIALITTVQLG